MNREDALWQGGRGKQRKYVFRKSIIRSTVQVAVVGANEDGFITEPITVSHFTIG